MPDVAIHPATSEVGEFLPQYVKNISQFLSEISFAFALTL